MNVTQTGFLTLLKSAVTKRALELPEGFELSAAYPLIRQHHVSALAFDGAKRCGVPLSDEIMQKLFREYGKSLVISERQMEQIRLICGAFEENGIDYMPLKGCNMKPRYPSPELRGMGDADILIRMEQYEKIGEILRSMGYSEKDATDHELPWQHDALYLELHKRLIPSYNKDLYAYFGDGWQLAHKSETTLHRMTAEDEFIYLFTHFAKHYRDGGVGCRHVLDLWVYRNTAGRLDEAYVEKEMERLNLLDFYRNVCALTDVWFENGAENEKTEFISEFIFDSGSWGRAESRALSRIVRDSKHTLPGTEGRLLYIWQTIFPGVQILKGKYTILKKAPWMLPLVWVYRGFYKLIFPRDSIRKHERNLAHMSRDELKNRQDMLNYVGLDYNF